MQAQLCTEDVLVLGGTAGAPTLGLGGAAGNVAGDGLVIRGSDIEDITAHSLGMLALSKDETSYVNSIIIKKNSKMNESFGRKYQFKGETLDVYVLQGESTNPYESDLLYKYVISGMPKGQKNEFDVNFLYNKNGVVEVNAVLANGQSLSAKQCEVTESISEIIARLTKEREEAKKRSNIEIMFMIDTSGSMSGEPVREAKRAMHEFVNTLNLEGGTKVAIVDFADSGDWACRFTSDKRTITRAIDGISIDGHNGWGNDFTPIDHYGTKFGSRDGARIAVVLTDGVWCNQGTEITASSRVKGDGVIIYAVGFGTADKAFLEKIASPDGARKVDLSKLTDTFKDIASSIATEMG